VPPEGYGGTELVVHLLTEDLVARGHNVTLFATGDSNTTAELVSVTDSPLRTNERYTMMQWPAFDIRLLLELEKRQDQFDIIHNHMGWQALPALSRMRCPSVTTNHNPIKQYAEDIYLAYKDMPYVAISNTYKRLNYPDQLNYIDVVYNGINCTTYAGDNGGTRDYLLFIGRLDKDKGAADAVKIAKCLNLPLKLAGKLEKKDQAYFDEQIKPQLQKPGFEYVGEVEQADKVKLYKSALAVVYPVAFDEPFGLVMAEALASGTPVMALDRGAVREILTDGETAIVGNTIEELVARFDEIKSIDPATCRKAIHTKFDVEHMVSGYEAVYEKVLAGKSLSLNTAGC
jgi:glycosyltransferase involved in cell wall biosynthesis